MKRNNLVKSLLAFILIMGTLFSMSSIVSAEFVENIFSEINDIMYLTSSNEEDDDGVESHNCFDYWEEETLFCPNCQEWVITLYKCSKCGSYTSLPQPPRHTCN